jgi:integrase/recombinase XerD
VKHLPRAGRSAAAVAAIAAVGFAPGFAIVRAQTLPPDFVAEPVAGGWNQPTCVCFAGADDLLVAEKAGLLWDVRRGFKHGKPVLDLQLEVMNNGDRGLLSVAVDPLWDVAIALRHWVPVRDPDDLDEARRGVDQVARYHAYCEVYGVVPDDRDRLVHAGLAFLDQAYAQSGRTGLMLQTLLETGARASELVQLRVEDVSLGERVITIRHGKGDKRREVPIRRELTQLLRLHIGGRRAGRLFVSRQQGSGPTSHMLTRQRVGQVVCGVARTAGITKRVYPHLLRHTVATRLLALGMDIADLQRFLGHESIVTTRLYAETTAAALKRNFDRITDPAAHTLIADIRHRQGDEAAMLAAELLAQRRAERVSTAAA